jgi:hypothetical protein
MGRLLYPLWALLVFAVLGWVQVTDQASPQGNVEPRTNPASLRDNPGAYRPAYTTSGRILRGK